MSRTTTITDLQAALGAIGFAQEMPFSGDFLCKASQVLDKRAATRLASGNTHKEQPW